MFIPRMIQRNKQRVPSNIVKRTMFNNFPNAMPSRPDKNETTEFIFSSIKVIVFSSIVWGFESNRKYQLHHLDVNHRILSNYSDCLKRQNTKEICQHEKTFLQYIFKPDF